jgi:hypothetical protein
LLKTDPPKNKHFYLQEHYQATEDIKKKKFNPFKTEKEIQGTNKVPTGNAIN